MDGCHKGQLRIFNFLWIADTKKDFGLLFFSATLCKLFAA